MEKTLALSEQEYDVILNRTISVIDNAKKNIAKHINTNVSSAYWEIGAILFEKKIESKHGNGVVNRLSCDLKNIYPDMGVSPRQLWDMKKFFVRFKESDQKLRQAVAVLPWTHILRLMNKELDDNAVLYYALESVKKGWNRDLLLNAINMKMHKNNRISLPPANNFAETLPAFQAEYANEVFKDSYNLGFLGVTTPIKELELERRIVAKIKQFLLELGKGFAYIGEQYVIEYAGKESRVDLLLYHRKMRCLVAIDLKIGEFMPEYAGKMNYYLSVLDRVERNEDENRSIGIILCAAKDHVQVELALEDLGKPIGVADYQLIIPQKELSDIIKNEMVAYEEDNHTSNLS